MTHRLRQRHPDNAVGPDPLIVSLRYRCGCTGGEVITIQLLIDLDTPEDAFVWSMKQAREDMRFEIAQHTGKAK